MFIQISVIIVLVFFIGVVTGAVLTLISDGSAPHFPDMEDSYQPYEDALVCCNDFDDCAKVLIKYLAENHHPHMTVIVTSTNAQLLEGVTTTGEITEFLKD